MKSPSSFRASKLTVSQLTALTAKTGMNQTEVISVAIDRMFNKEIMMNTNFVDHQDKVGKAITHLEELGFSTAEIEILIHWFFSGYDDEQIKWLGTATKQQITEVAQPAFE